MHDRTIEVRAERILYTNTIDLAVLQRTDGGRLAAALPLTLKVIEPGEMVQPAMRLTQEQAQGLMDELWRCGLRPAEGTGSAGALAATQKHLEDMQAIAVGLLRREGVDL